MFPFIPAPTLPTINIRHHRSTFVTIDYYFLKMRKLRVYEIRLLGGRAPSFPGEACLLCSLWQLASASDLSLAWCSFRFSQPSFPQGNVSSGAASDKKVCLDCCLVFTHLEILLQWITEVLEKLWLDSLKWLFIFPFCHFPVLQRLGRKVDTVILKMFCVEILSESPRRYFHGTIKSFQAQFDRIYCQAFKIRVFQSINCYV